MAAQLTLTSPASQSTLTHWADGSLNTDHDPTRNAAHTNNITAENLTPPLVRHPDFISKHLGFNKDTADSIYKNQFREETDKNTAKGMPIVD